MDLTNLNKIRLIILDVLLIEARKSVRQNFQAEGRPAWPAKKHDDGRGILRGRTHRLFNTLDFKINGNTIEMGSNLPYARIHQEGGTIHRKPGTVKLRTTRAGQTRFASGKHKKTREVSHAGYVITIPPRPFLVIPEEDYPRIVRNIQQAIKV